MNENPTRVAVDAELIDLLRAWREQWNNRPGFTPNDVDLALMKAVDALPPAQQIPVRDYTVAECDECPDEVRMVPVGDWHFTPGGALCEKCAREPHTFELDPESVDLCWRCDGEESDHQPAGGQRIETGAVNG